MRLRIGCLSVVFVCSVASMSAQTSGTPATITGGGTTGRIPVWLSSSKLGNSRLFQSTSGEIGLGTASPAATLDVNGTINAASSFNLGGNAFAFGSQANGNLFLGFAGNSTTTGTDNTAVGVGALLSNTSGPGNTAVGQNSMGANTTGNDNTAIGSGALHSNTSGYVNTVIGVEAMLSNTTGWDNTAVGINALDLNTTGNDNVVVGGNAAASNTSGYGNMATGAYSLQLNSTGIFNTAVGYYALQWNATGSNDTGLGYNAGPDSGSPNLTNATAIGANAVVSESNALVLGGTGTNAVKVGIGTATPSNVFTIAQGSGAAISDGWTTYSSRRWKTNIETLHGALEQVLQLRGVSYDSANSGKHEIGVIAEEVANVVPEIVSSDKSGARGVDYSRLVAVLIEAVKEQQEQIRVQQDQITGLTSEVSTMRISSDGVRICSAK